MTGEQTWGYSFFRSVSTEQSKHQWRHFCWPYILQRFKMCENYTKYDPLFWVRTQHIRCLFESSVFLLGLHNWAQSLTRLYSHKMFVIPCFWQDWKCSRRGLSWDKYFSTSASIQNQDIKLHENKNKSVGGEKKIHLNFFFKLSLGQLLLYFHQLTHFYLTTVSTWMLDKLLGMYLDRGQVNIRNKVNLSRFPFDIF